MHSLICCRHAEGMHGLRLRCLLNCPSLSSSPPSSHCIPSLASSHHISCFSPSPLVAGLGSNPRTIEAQKHHGNESLLSSHGIYLIDIWRFPELLRGLAITLPLNWTKTTKVKGKIWGCTLIGSSESPHHRIFWLAILMYIRAQTPTSVQAVTLCFWPAI